MLGLHLASEPVGIVGSSGAAATVASLLLLLLLLHGLALAHALLLIVVVWLLLSLLLLLLLLLLGRHAVTLAAVGCVRLLRVLLAVVIHDGEAERCGGERRLVSRASATASRCRQACLGGVLGTGQLSLKYPLGRSRVLGVSEYQSGCSGV